MNNLNPIAVFLWLILTCIGFLFGGIKGAVVGLLIGLGLSLVANILVWYERKKLMEYYDR